MICRYYEPIWPTQYADHYQGCKVTRHGDHVTFGGERRFSHNADSKAGHSPKRAQFQEQLAYAKKSGSSPKCTCAANDTQAFSTPRRSPGRPPSLHPLVPLYGRKTSPNRVQAPEKQKWSPRKLCSRPPSPPVASCMQVSQKQNRLPRKLSPRLPTPPVGSGKLFPRLPTPPVASCSTSNNNPLHDDSATPESELVVYKSNNNPLYDPATPESELVVNNNPLYDVGVTSESELSGPELVTMERGGGGRFLVTRIPYWVVEAVGLLVVAGLVTFGLLILAEWMCGAYMGKSCCGSLGIWRMRIWRILPVCMTKGRPQLMADGFKGEVVTWVSCPFTSRDSFFSS